MAFTAQDVKKLREMNGINQAELAERLNVNKSLISAYENELRMPSLHVLAKLAYHFNVSMEFLLGIKRDNTIDVSKLTTQQIAVVTSVIREFETANKNWFFMEQKDKNYSNLSKSIAFWVLKVYN